MATYNFDLLDLADGESGEAAVSVAAAKKKTEVAAANVADPRAVPDAQEKQKFSHWAKLHHDEGVRLCRQELNKLWKAQKKLWGEETELRKQPGNEARLKELSDEDKKLRLEERKLKQQKKTLEQQRETFYKENGIILPEEVKKDKSTSNGSNADPGSNNRDANGNVSNNNDGGNNMEYSVKAKPSSDAGTETEHKVSSDAGTEGGTNNVVPPSESEKSAGGAAQDGAKSGQGAATRTRTFEKILINGSEKRKKKKSAKKNSGNEPEKVSKQDSKVDGLKKQAEQQALPVYPREEEKKTLAEYEKIREEKKKTSETSKTEVRKVTAEVFEGMQILEKKKLDDEEAVIKVEKSKVNKEASKKEEVQGKEAATKDGKPKKVFVSRQNLGFKQPMRVTYNAQDGSFTRRFDGPFQGGNRENSTSTETQVSGRGMENGKAARNEAGGNNGDAAPRGTYNGRGNGASRGDFSGSRDGYRGGNGGYGYGRGNGGYGYGRGNGGHQGNGDYNRQQQGGNVGRFHQERAGNGGYYPQQQRGHYQRRPGNDRYYQQRGNSGFRRSPSPTPAPSEPALLGVEDLSKFPALSPPASAPSAAPASRDGNGEIPVGDRLPIPVPVGRKIPRPRPR